MGCTRLLDAICWVQSWGDWVLPWQGVRRGSRITPGGDELSTGWVGVTGSGDSWGGCSAILGGAASPGLILPGMWDCMCEAEPCAPHTAACARFGILQDQHKKCCGEHGVASPSSSSSSSSSSAGSRAQQDKPRLCQAAAKGTAENKD